MQTTKIYENTTDKAVNVVGVGIIEAHDRISISTEYHAPVNLVNFPGIIDVLAEEANGTLPTASVAETVEVKTAAPALPQVQEKVEAEAQHNV
jgi:hypothetical protein